MVPIQARAVLIIFAVFALALGWIVDLRRRGEVQRAVATRVAALGGKAVYEDGGERSSFRCVCPAPPPTKGLLRDILRDDAIVNIKKMTLQSTEATDEDVKNVTTIRRLESLTLADAPITGRFVVFAS